MALVLARHAPAIRRRTTFLVRPFRGITNSCSRQLVIPRKSARRGQVCRSWSGCSPMHWRNSTLGSLPRRNRARRGRRLCACWPRQGWVLTELSSGLCHRLQRMTRAAEYGQNDKNPGSYVLDLFLPQSHFAPMHPPAFRRSHRLSDWPECSLELRCRCSPGTTLMPVKLLITQRGGLAFATILDRLRCSRCRARPAPVYLVAGHTRSFINGPPADWSLELVPTPS